MPAEPPLEDIARQEDALHRSCRHLLLRAPLFVPLLALLGVLLGGQAYALSVLALAAAWFVRLYRIFFCALLCGLLGWFQQELRWQKEGNFRRLCEERDAVRMEGVVTDMLANGCIVDGGCLSVRVALRGECPFRLGERVRFLGAPQQPEEPPVKGMFSPQEWMRGQGLAGALSYIRGESLGMSISLASLRGVALRFRQSLSARLLSGGGESDPRAQLLCALLLGDKSHSGEESLLDFRRGGCMHAFAVSGLHVAVLAALLVSLFRLLRISPARSRFLLLLCCGLYVLLTGCSVPALRAYLMLAICLLALILQRRMSYLNTWSLAALLVLLFQGWQINNAGFLLSFFVYAGIAIGVRLCAADAPLFGPDSFIPKRIHTDAEHRLQLAERTLRGCIVVSLSAWLASLPICCGSFHSVNIYGWLCNIVIAPLFPLVIGLGMAALVFSSLPLLGAASLALARQAAGLLLAAVAFFGDLPHAYMPMESPREADSMLVMGLGYGQSACQLGNPGLLIGCGNAVSAKLKLCPALFHRGYTPAMLLLSGKAKGSTGGAESVRLYWPHCLFFRSGEEGESPRIYRNAAGIFRIFPPPADLPRGMSANAEPVLLWHCGSRRVLYVGNASRETWERVPEKLRHADVLLLGYNPKSPLADSAVLRAVGAAKIICLPSLPQGLLRPEDLAPCELIRLKDDAFYEGRP